MSASGIRKLTYNNSGLHTNLIHILDMLFRLHREVGKGNPKLVILELRSQFSDSGWEAMMVHIDATSTLEGGGLLS